MARRDPDQAAGLERDLLRSNEQRRTPPNHVLELELAVTVPLGVRSRETKSGELTIERSGNRKVSLHDVGFRPMHKSRRWLQAGRRYEAHGYTLLKPAPSEPETDGSPNVPEEDDTRAEECMSSIIWAGFLAFFVASLVVGVRLLLLWRKTRELPELLIGIGVLGIGPVGFGLMVVGQIVSNSGHDSLAGAIYGIAQLAVYSGVLAKYVFNWRVYHPQSKPILALVGAAALALVSLTLYRMAIRDFVPTPTPDAISLTSSAIQLGALFWGSVEALRYWSQMRKRTRLGLADPAVTNRFLLWSIGAGAAGLGSAIGTVASMVVGMPSLEIPWVVAISSAHGMVAAVAMWLAFLPPRAWLRFVRRKVRTS